MSKNSIPQFLLSALLLVLLTSVAHAATVPVTVDSVEVDGQEVFTGATNRLSIERDQDFEVTVRFTATASTSNVEVEGFVSGYEYNDIERVFDSTPVFDVLANTTYTKRLFLRLPSDADSDDYKLRLVLADRNNDALIRNYEIRIDAPRHLLRIDDVNLFSASSGNEVYGGDPVLANVRIKNLGERDEDDIKVHISIPELGVSATKYIDEIREGKSEDTGSVYLRLPNCANAGTYTVRTEVSYDNYKRDLIDNTQTVRVLRNEACDKKEPVKTVVEVQLPPQPSAALVADDEADNDDRMDSIKSALEIFLIVLFGIFIVVGIIVFFTKLMKDEDDE